MDRLGRLARHIGNTPVYELQHIPIPNGNRIFAKEEWRNPSGSHYDRIYLTLFRAIEADGKITRGRTRLIEVSSGCAGASFAWFAKQLGYPATVIVPADLPASRINAIARHGPDIIQSPAGQYVAGAVGTLQRVLLDDRRRHTARDQRFYCLNHSQDPRSLLAMHPIADELQHQLPAPPQFFIGACGNGTTLIGIGQALKHLYTRLSVIAADPAEAPVAYVRRYPGRYERTYGHPPTPEQHDVYGTGAWGIPFPFLDGPNFSAVVDEGHLVQPNERRDALHLLHRAEGKAVGHSSALTLAIALKLCQKVRNTAFVLLFYDSIEAYI